MEYKTLKEAANDLGISQLTARNYSYRPEFANHMKKTIIDKHSHVVVMDYPAFKQKFLQFMENKIKRKLVDNKINNS